MQKRNFSNSEIFFQTEKYSPAKNKFSFFKSGNFWPRKNRFLMSENNSTEKNFTQKTFFCWNEKKHTKLERPRILYILIEIIRFSKIFCTITQNKIILSEKSKISKFQTQNFQRSPKSPTKRGPGKIASGI